MGERAHRAYEESERQAFRRLPLGLRIAANLKSAALVGAIAFILFWIFVYPTIATAL